MKGISSSINWLIMHDFIIINRNGDLKKLIPQFRIGADAPSRLFTFQAQRIEFDDSATKDSQTS